MSDALKAAITELMEQIAAKESEITPLKFAVNTLCRQLQMPDAYEITLGQSGLGVAPKAKSPTWRPDQFFNRPLAGCVVEIFETRHQQGSDKPASIDEIFTALRDGGYKFEGTSGNDENTKRGVKIALTKNTAQFVKIKDDVFSLKKWYGNGRSRKPSTKSPGAGPTADAPEEEEIDPNLEFDVIPDEPEPTPTGDDTKV